MRYSVLAALACGALLVGGATANAAPRPDPWVQGQIDAQTENVPGFLRSIELAGVDRGGISDADLAIKGRTVCYQIYAGKGDVSGAALPNTRRDDYHSLEVVAGASIKYLCPPAAAFAGSLADKAP
ncbi:DUF732 domain-containing protein [Nocardia camponoti]|uniref:DUF732 domain-containing protein n=1 Tax=Nocardia camponoti TaxID=1616106 RepID=A0A917Q9I6_9NOCA|nr:DUF732 domain-containing protein [Nocardia camponoti]GGK38567.1 hypothetical protein GCM10011591_07880 [Nocardia camponoti]